MRMVHRLAVGPHGRGYRRADDPASVRVKLERLDAAASRSGANQTA